MREPTAKTKRKGNVKNVETKKGRKVKTPRGIRRAVNRQEIVNRSPWGRDGEKMRGRKRGGG